MKTKTKTPPSKESTTPISVAPRTSGERNTLKKAAEAAGVSLSLYILKSALVIAAEEGFHAPVVDEWEPRKKKSECVCSTKCSPALGRHVHEGETCPEHPNAPVIPSHPLAKQKA